MFGPVAGPAFSLGPLLPTRFFSLSCSAVCGRIRARLVALLRRPLWLWLRARVLLAASLHFVRISRRALAGLPMTGSHPKSTSQRPARSLPVPSFANLQVFSGASETIRQAASLLDKGIIAMGQPAYRKALLLCLAAATEATKVSERKWKAAADEALAAFKPIRKSVNSCVEIKILRRVRPESSRRPPRHRRDACSSSCWCRFLAARPSQDDRVIAKK